MVSKRNVFCIGFGLFGLVLLFIIGKFVYIYWYLNPSVKVGPTVSRSWKEEDGLTENLMWMIQISDIHLSAFRDKSRLNHFSEFCNTTIGTIKPQVVLATGDITDGTAENGFVTYQIKEEWKFYRDVLNKNRVPEKVIWLDIRGNHGNSFNKNKSATTLFRNLRIKKITAVGVIDGRRLHSVKHFMANVPHRVLAFLKYANISRSETLQISYKNYLPRV